jgi:hypothetical protein
MTPFETHRNLQSGTGCGTITLTEKPVYQLSAEFSEDHYIDARPWFSVESCGTDYSIDFTEADGSGLAPIFFIDLYTDGIVKMRTTGIKDYDQLDYELMAHFGSVSSVTGSCVVQTFRIEIVDAPPDCCCVTHTNPIFEIGEIRQYLYNRELFPVRAPTASEDNCNSYTYSLRLYRNDNIIDPDVYNVQPYSMDDEFVYLEGLPITRNWIDDSPIEVYLRAFGRWDYQTKESNPINLIVMDPCENTEMITRTIDDMTTFLNEIDRPVQDFSAFTDTESTLYSGSFGDGSNADICGPRTYTIYEKIGDDLVPAAFI